MQFVSFEDAPLHTRGQNHRVGTFRYKDLGQGTPGHPGNFYLRWVLSERDFHSPRHHHNFDQVRLQLRGTFAFGDDGTMLPGTIGFFPESTPYGPQTSEEDTVQLVMQVGGASGAGYVGEAERTAAVAALHRTGRFEGGRYFGPDGQAGTGQDGFEAAWEHATGRKVRYAKRRFEKPMLVHPEAIEWLPLPQTPGVQGRRGWDFGPRTVGCNFYRIAPGAALELTGPLTAWVQSGAGSVGTGEQARRYAESDALHLQRAESVRLQAETVTELLVLSHPVFPDPPAAAAAAPPASPR